MAQGKGKSALNLGENSKRGRRDSNFDLEDGFDYYAYENEGNIDSDLEMADCEDDLSDRMHAKNKTPGASRKRKSLALNDSKRSTPLIKPPLQFKTTKINTNKDLHLKSDRLSIKIDRICEYAEVLMHCILFKTNFYNKKTHFDKCLKYNIIVYVNCFEN